MIILSYSIYIITPQHLVCAANVGLCEYVATVSPDATNIVSYWFVPGTVEHLLQH